MSQSQPSSTSGWLRDWIRLTFPSRVVALMLQPTGQRPQTVGTFWISHGPRLEPVLGGGERADWAELDHVAGEGRAVRLVLEGRDHRLRAAVSRDELPVLRDFLGEARAAVAEDAALAVEGDQRG